VRDGGVSYSWSEAVYEEDGGPGFGMPGYVDAFRYEVEYFVEQCVLGGKAPLSTLGDALDALRMVEAAERSAAHGREVTLRWE
jgi:predicted dehydrogenase